MAKSCYVFLVISFISLFCECRAAKRRYFKFGGNWKSWRDTSDEDSNSLVKSRPTFGRRSLPDKNTTHTENREAIENSQVELTCGVDPEGYPNVRWSRYGQPLPPNAREQDGKITFQSIQLGDAGTYVCTASNNWETKEIHVRLTVRPSNGLREQTGAISHCQPDQATCGSGECIGRNQLCDGDIDCRDGSDERHCGRSSTPGDCEPNEYKCNNGRCIQRMWVCDGEDDCGDRSDEHSCGQRQPGEQCALYEFKCHSQNQCIPSAYHCDKNNDCFDGSDEIGCTGPTAVEAPERDVSVRCGETVVLTCRTIGVPTPYVNWRLNWGPVCAPPRCTQTSSNGFGTLTIRNVQDTDQGAYSCEAVNVVNRILVSPDSIVRVDCAGKPFGGKPFGERNCDPRGAEMARDDGTGPCQCKQLVTGARCEQCLDGSFHLSENNPLGCVRCFCSGVTKVCQSSGWHRTQERLHFTLGNPNVTLSGREKSTPIVDFDQTAHRGYITHSSRHVGTLYWHLPRRMLANKITAYGGKLRFNFQFSGSGDPDARPLVILKGHEITAVYRGQPSYAVDSVHDVVIDMYENAWTREDVSPMTREHFLMVLSNLDSFMIRATHVSQHTSTSLGEISLDIAVPQDTQQERAMAVEECRCPEGYQGLSCEDCAPGFERSGGGLYLGTCVRGGSGGGRGGGTGGGDSGTVPIRLDPKRQEDDEGSSVTFRAVVDGDAGGPGSGYVYVWTRDGYPQLPDNAIAQGNTLTINDMRIEDKGTYKVTVRSPTGETGSGEGELKVKRVGVCPYVWIEPVKVWRGPPGERVEFHCKAIGEPAPKLYWVKADGRPLDPNSRDKGDGTLIIESVDPRNYGQYTCRGENKAGQNSANATIAEGGPADKSITVRIRPSNTIASKRYDTVYVHCEATGTPTPVITWSREDGSPLHSNAQDQGNGILRFLSIEKINAGLYRCMARNQHTQVSDIANILPPTDIRSVPPYVVVDPREKEARVGEEIRIACAAVADSRDPSPRLVWTRQGGRALDDDITDNGNGYLQISSFELHHAGVYECTAFGVYSKSIGTATLRLKQELGQTPPVPEVSPKIQTIVEGDRAEFKCKVDGHPSPTLTWAFGSANGPLLSNVRQENGLLIIDKAEHPTNEGQYFCTATNAFGSNSASGTLFVEKIPTLPKIEITSQKHWSGKSGSNFNFECVATGHPKPKITWTREGDNEIEDNVETDANGRLIFSNAQYSNSGKYICTASNSAGESHDTVDVVVKSEISAKIFYGGKEADDVIEIEEHSPLKLECSGVGDPEPNAKWKIHSNVDGSGYGPFKTSDQFLSHDFVSRDHAGTYNCTASNKFGFAEDTIKVQVIPRKKQSVLILGSNDRYEDLDTRLELRCVSTDHSSRHTLRWVRKLPNGFSLPIENEEALQGLLTVTDFDEGDTGIYECQAMDEESQVIGFDEIQINQRSGDSPNKAITVEGGPIKYVMAGEQLRLKCAAAPESDALVELQWLRMEKGIFHPVIKGAVVDGSLRINNVSMDDAGIYSCIRYSDGQRDGSYQVAVVVSNTEMRAIQVKPEIGSTVELQCPIFYVPIMTYEWNRVSGAQLPVGVRYNERVLRIQDFKADYAGTYECEVTIDGETIKGYLQVAPSGVDKLAAIMRALASNIGTTMSTDAPINVDTQPTQRPYMELEMDVMPDFAFPGKDVTLRCTVDAEPKAQIRWERIGRPLPRTAYASGQQLKLRKLQGGDIGRYRCTASTEIGLIAAETVVKMGEKVSGNVIRRYYDP